MIEKQKRENREPNRVISWLTLPCLVIGIGILMAGVGWELHKLTSSVPNQNCQIRLGQYDALMSVRIVYEPDKFDEWQEIIQNESSGVDVVLFRCQTVRVITSKGIVVAPVLYDEVPLSSDTDAVGLVVWEDGGWIWSYSHLIQGSNHSLLGETRMWPRN